MIQSMTGYGKATCVIGNKQCVIEIKGLNSKGLDLTVKVPNLLRNKELELRNLLVHRLERGKVDFAVTFTAENSLNDDLPTINETAFEYYFQQVSNLHTQHHFSTPLSIEAILSLPNVLQSKDMQTLQDEEYAQIVQATEEAIEHFIDFRKQDGKQIEAMFCKSLNAIQDLLAQIEPYEKDRVAKIKARIWSNLEELQAKDNVPIDTNRLEQEMIYYLEKLDISEEKVRLKSHIDYFFQTLNDAKTSAIGKKLGFIAQEMGREINTLGSKSNQSEMQIIVVQMKDILEQIKEQVLNVF